MGSKIPEKQWAQVIEKVGGPVEYKEIPVQKPGPGEVLVNIKYSGVCHTDLHAVNGDWPIPTKLPLVGGHEGAGIVVARGDDVRDEDCKIGEAVGVKWLNDSCLSCTFCMQADEPLCLTPKLSGYTVDGTFQQYCIASAKHVAHIPEGVPLDEVAPILCAGVSAPVVLLPFIRADIASDHRVQGLEGVGSPTWPDCGHCRCWWWTRVVGSAIREGDGSSRHCH